MPEQEQLQAPFGEKLMTITEQAGIGLGSISCIRTPGTTEQDDTITTMKGEDYFQEEPLVLVGNVEDLY